MENGFKYMRILVTDRVKDHEMKNKIQKEYTQ